MVLNARQEQQ